MNTNILTISRVLEFVDVPQIVLARDKFDTQYLCLLYTDEPECQYTAIRISTERLAEFYHHDVDLRTLFLKPEFAGEYFDVHLENGNYVPEIMPSKTISEERLPAEGYYLDDDDEKVTIRVPKRERNYFLSLISRHGWVAM